MSHTRILTIFLVIASIALGDVAALDVGDCICREGIIMDRFCINRERLLDNGRVRTLEGPDQHSMHCLLDVSLCVNSGFTVLGDPEQAGEEYTVAAQFDDAGSQLMYDFASERGRRNTCNDCTGNLGDYTFGFRAAVVGIVENVGDSTSKDPLQQAPSIKVTDIMDSSQGCATFTCPETDDTDLPKDTPVSSPPESDTSDTSDTNAEPSENGTEETDGQTEETMDSSKVVDCNELQSKITLSETPLVTMEFVVNVPGTETNYEFSPAAEAAGGVLTATLTYEGEGYVAIATSRDGLMPNAEAIMCLPDEAAPVSKYFLGDRNAAAIALVDAQTLLNTDITQEGGTTTCTFTKLLNEEGEIPIDPNGSNTFIWAIGNDNTIFYHRSRGQVVIDFEQCTPSGVAEVIAVQPAGSYDSFWKIHGILMGLAWGFFAPVAIVSAVCRRLLPGDSLWFQIHRACNTLCALFTIAGFGLAVAAYSGTGIPHFNGPHQKIGLSIFVIVLFQVIGGMLRPHAPKKDDSSDVEKGTPPDPNNPTKPGKTTARTSWEIAHRLIGLALLGMGMYNGYTGLILYSGRGLGNASDFTNLWWGWLGAFLGLAFLYSIFDRVISSERSDK